MTEYGRIHTDGSRSGGQPLLLPCPFCGGVQIEAFHHIDRGWGASWHVECVAEECGNSTCHHDTEANAIAAWNTRQPTQSDAEIIAENKRLREALVQIGYDFGSGYLAVEIARAALQGQNK